MYGSPSAEHYAASPRWSSGTTHGRWSGQNGRSAAFAPSTYRSVWPTFTGPPFIGQVVCARHRASCFLVPFSFMPMANVSQASSLLRWRCQRWRSTSGCECLAGLGYRTRGFSGLRVHDPLITVMRESHWSSLHGGIPVTSSWTPLCPCHCKAGLSPVKAQYVSAEVP